MTDKIKCPCCGNESFIDCGTDKNTTSPNVFVRTSAMGGQLGRTHMFVTNVAF